MAVGENVAQVWGTPDRCENHCSVAAEPQDVHWKGRAGRWHLSDSPKNPTRHHVWDLAGGPMTFDGKYLVEGRGDEYRLIVGDKDRQLYFTDLNSKSLPRAIPLFELPPSGTLSPHPKAAQRRVFALDPTAIVAHVWNAAQFEAHRWFRSSREFQEFRRQCL